MVDVVVTGFDIGREVGTVFMGVFWGYLFLLSFDVLTGLIASAVQGKLNSNISFQGMMKKVASVVALAFVSFVDVYFKRSEEHTSELQSRGHLVCRLLLEKKKK